MQLYTFKKEQKISKNIESVFLFFSKPENLSVITPSKMNFKILTPSPVEMKEGALIDYTVSILGFSVRWRTLITHYKPSDMFVDQQLKGPYSMWHHTHFFEKINDNETLIKDLVVYAVPFGIIGKLAHSLYIKRDLDDIFNFRSQKISEIFND